jgi:hypothetical protein
VGLVIGGIIAGIYIPQHVFAGWINNRASAQGIRTETIQTLPILQARFSPMTLTPIESSTITTDQDAFVVSINIYDEQDIDVPSRDTITTYIVQSGTHFQKLLIVSMYQQTLFVGQTIYQQRQL